MTEQTYYYCYECQAVCLTPQPTYSGDELWSVECECGSTNTRIATDKGVDFQSATGTQPEPIE